MFNVMITLDAPFNLFEAIEHMYNLSIPAGQLQLFCEFSLSKLSLF